MSVIAELQIAPDEFELGDILDMRGSDTVELETMVPLGQIAVPFVRVHADAREEFRSRVSEHGSVTQLREVNRENGSALYALDWDVSNDSLFTTMMAVDAQLLTASGTASQWFLEIRFTSHDALTRFHAQCSDHGIEITIVRLYNPTKPSSNPHFGLTTQQFETLVRAVEAGYYSIPRQISTKQLAEEFGISDQAVTERLRRAIIALTEHTLLVEAGALTDETSD